MNVSDEIIDTYIDSVISLWKADELFCKDRLKLMLDKAKARHSCIFLM